MRLLFVNLTSVAFTVETPAREPLGGTESCAAYLTRQLAANGHDVTLLANLPPGTPKRLGGVRHVPMSAGDDPAFFQHADFEAVIVLSAPTAAPVFKRLAPGAVQVAWLHMLADQPNMAPLARMTPLIDCAVYVSNTQRAAMPFAGPTQVIGNAIAPAFEELFASAEELASVKENRAAYTSMPFRGLDVLADAFAQAKIESELDVYSAMRTYQEKDDSFATLYELLKAMPRCHYHGAVAQSELAGRLRSAAFLAYPSTFAETYCIAALEAIAAGLKVIATDLGALPETTLGFADLLPLERGKSRASLATLFAARLEHHAGDFLTRRQAWAEERFEQAQTVNRLCNWRARAREWEEFLGPAIAWRRGS